MTDIAVLIKAKGYTVEECRARWKYSRATWSRHVNNPAYNKRLIDLINGLPTK